MKPVWVTIAQMLNQMIHFELPLFDLNAHPQKHKSNPSPSQIPKPNIKPKRPYNRYKTS